jgi:hypothetical protein
VALAVVAARRGEKPMEIGSLEYIVIDVEDSHFTREILPKLKAIQASGAVRIVDLMLSIKTCWGRQRYGE